MTNDHVANVKNVALLTQHDRGPLRQEVTDAMWADYGRMVAWRIGATDDLVAVLNRAGLRAKSVREMTAMIQAFILTGTKP